MVTRPNIKRSVCSFSKLERIKRSEKNVAITKTRFLFCVLLIMCLLTRLMPIRRSEKLMRKNNIFEIVCPNKDKGIKNIAANVGYEKWPPSSICTLAPLRKRMVAA